MNKRFQDCNLTERLYRRLKYQPYYFIKAIWVVVKNAFNTQRKESLSLYFTLIYTTWQIKANWVHSLDDIFEDM